MRLYTRGDQKHSHRWPTYHIPQIFTQEIYKGKEKEKRERERKKKIRAEQGRAEADHTIPSSGSVGGEEGEGAGGEAGAGVREGGAREARAVPGAEPRRGRSQARRRAGGAQSTRESAPKSNPSTSAAEKPDFGKC
ncbi:MAG: hypothetical protein QXO23_04490 [Candidatus Methanomethyliaceae archaeon]